MGDPTRFRQIITNLLSNAVKFTEKGVILLKIEPFAGNLVLHCWASIDIVGSPPSDYRIPGSTSQENANLKSVGFSIELTDTGIPKFLNILRTLGIGMNKEQVQAIFTQYTQAGRPSSKG